LALPPMNLARECEPELMDGCEQALAYAEADFSASDAALVEWIASNFPEGLGDWIIDLGCGPGNISFRLADRWPQARILGIDGASAMLDLARLRLQQQPRSGLLSFEKHLLPCPQLTASASALVSNSLLHHLHDPQVLWQSLQRLGRPNAVVVIHDLLRPHSEAELQNLVQLHAADASPLLRRDYTASLRAAFQPDEIAVQLQQAGLIGMHVQPRDDRYITVWGRLP
jgi:trans-aconitate methyltransferase